MRFFYEEKKVRNGYITAFGLLMISYFLVFFTIHQMEKRARMVNHTNEVINNLDILLSCIKDSETTFRGFALMEDTSVLDSYRFHLICINSTFEEIGRLLADDSIQKIQLDSLRNTVIQKNNLLDSTINEYLAGDMPGPNLLSGRIAEGTRIMNKIRSSVSTMQIYESERLAKRTTEFESMSASLKIIHFTTFSIALLLVIYSMVIFNNISRAKLQYRVQLEEGIEKLKEANDDLRNLRSIEKFAASGRIARAIAHEVRNPLTSISLAAEQLGTVLKAPEESSLLEIISRNVKRINNLIMELLNSTKFSHLNLGRVSLNSIVEQALELARDRIELNGIKVIENKSPNQCIIEADKERMSTAILNIVINAIEAMEPGKGVLDITTMRKNGKCLVVIRDNGIGMNDSALTRIFEPYFTQKENGNGLGLTLTQNIILNHKGNISVDSKPKKGSIFTIVLDEAN